VALSYYVVNATADSVMTQICHADGVGTATAMGITGK
jgi:hypothetical protein